VHARENSAYTDVNQNLDQNVTFVHQFYNNLGGQLRYFLDVAGIRVPHKFINKHYPYNINPFWK